MADLNQFQRSKERISELLHLMHKKNADEETASYINTLELSMKKLDHKMEEIKNQEVNKNQNWQ